MTLRRRIAAAAAVAVAAVAAALAASGYLSTRANLRGQLDQALSERAAPFLAPHAPQRQQGGGFGPGRPGLRGPSGHAGRPGPPPGGSPFAGSPATPPAPGFGDAPGYFQFVSPDGHVSAGGGGTPQIPVDARAREIAASGHGRYFTDVTVHGTALRVLTVADPYDHYAVQVARPLTEVDQALHSLLITYLALVAGGILLAALIGTLIGRSALAPIERFTKRTERVTDALDGSQRIEETGATELERLAVSFNRTLDALEASVRAQRHLIADASHELRTPIASLRSNIQIFLEADRLPLEERRSLQHDLIAELDELTQLVSDVLELARGISPGDQLEPIALDRVVADAVERTRRRAPEIALEVRLQPTTILNAPDRVARAVTNVLDNARKWSPHDGAIEIVLADATLTVRDHGPGFADEDLAHVFDRFYRAQEARRLPGAGLGLAIVRNAAEAYGGWVKVRNAQDGGAILAVSFGNAIAPEAAQAPEGSGRLTRSS